jgi:hypothetical protein
MVRINFAEVLRLRAIKPLLRVRSARRCAQDDGFGGAVEKPSGFDGKWTKRRITGSQDDSFCGERLRKAPIALRSGVTATLTALGKELRPA